jgi:tetratricopeptide (TPR) repeat protein
LDEVLRISLEVNSKPATFYALYGLGRVAQSQGDFASAHEFYAEALGLQRWQVGAPRGGAPYAWDWLKTYRFAVAYPLGGLAVLVSAQNQMERAALLFGVIEGHYKPLRFQMSAVERSEHDQAASAVRAALGEDAFQAAYDEGKKMTLDEAVTYALEEN